MKNRKNKVDGNCRHKKTKNISRKLQAIQENRSNNRASLFPTCNCGLKRFSTAYTPWIIYFCVLAYRLIYVSQKDNWWILHPDEIFQSVEVAFSEVFGYGFRTYEYLPPPVNITSHVEEQEYTNGMFSLRSFLFPRFYIILFQLANFTGIEYNPYLLARQMHVCVTSLLPVSIFYMTRSIYACDGISLLSAVLVAFSLPLTELGTHTLINSFISPFLFLAVIPFVSTLVKSNYIYISELSQHQKETDLKSSKDGTTKTDPDNKPDNGHNFLPKTADVTKIESSDYVKTPSEAPGAITDKVPHKHNNKKCATLNFIGGILLGVLVYIRFDSSLFVGTLFFTMLMVFIREGKVMSRIVLCLACTCLGVITGALVGGFEDRYRYNTFFLTPFQWFRFNILSGIPSVLFGIQNTGEYFNTIFCKDALMAIINCCAIAGVMTGVFKRSKCLEENTDKKTTVCLFLVCFVTFGLYASVGHKEPRFLHNVITLSLVVVAYGLHTLFSVLSTFVGSKKSRIAFVAFSLVYVANWYNAVQFNLSKEALQASKHSIGSSNVNKCIDFIGRRNDVTGVFIDQSVYVTGGFSILRKNVPVIILFHNEYHEYSKDSNATEKPNLRVVNRFSDFISVLNIDYLKRILFENQKYNYIVTSLKRKETFEDLGFQIIYSSNNYIVLYRDGEFIKRRKRIRKINRNQPKNIENSTILEYESNWLFTAGVYEKAIERLERAIQIDDSSIRAFHVLMECYSRVGNYTEAFNVEQRCFKRHGRVKCNQSQPKLVIHNDYLKFDIVT